MRTRIATPPVQWVCHGTEGTSSLCHEPDGTAHLLVEGTITTRAFPRMIRPLLSPPWLPVLWRLGICPSPIGGGSICRGLDITPGTCAQYAQAQADQQKTCRHVQAPFSRQEWNTISDPLGTVESVTPPGWQVIKTL